jgi:hypothetical protein
VVTDTMAKYSSTGTIMAAIMDLVVTAMAMNYLVVWPLGTMGTMDIMGTMVIMAHLVIMDMDTLDITIMDRSDTMDMDRLDTMHMDHADHAVTMTSDITRVIQDNVNKNNVHRVSTSAGE